MHLGQMVLSPEPDMLRTDAESTFMKSQRNQSLCKLGKKLAMCFLSMLFHVCSISCQGYLRENMLLE